MAKKDPPRCRICGQPLRWHNAEVRAEHERRTAELPPTPTDSPYEDLL